VLRSNQIADFLHSSNAPCNTPGNLHYFSCNNTIIIDHDFVIKYTSAWIIALWIFMDKVSNRVSNWEKNINKCIVFGYILALHMHILAVYHTKQ